ncbi:MAG: hypothetical protein JW763_01815 [candidate division Zixibacteria bacterium]|nr:hypothetical protein [candidate division Zixibacteria bacterium]
MLREIIRETTVRIAVYQNQPVFGEIEHNLNRVLDDLSEHQFDLLVLPELFATGYLFADSAEAAALADTAGEGVTFTRLRELAESKDAIVIYGFPEKKGDKLFNSSLAILPDGGFHCYQKIHLFDTEKAIFLPGETGFFVIEHQGVRIGMMICFDWRFPESARKLALAGAQIICHPANLVLPHCPDAMITRALENNVFTITADRIGDESRGGKHVHFIGTSRIIAPNGVILAEIGDTETGFRMVEIDPVEADNKIITARNDIFRDRRPEYYWKDEC